MRRLLLVLLVAACGRGSVVIPDGDAGAGGVDAATVSSGATGGAGTGGSATTSSMSSGTGGAGGAPEICIAQGPCLSCVAVECPPLWCDCLDDPECLALFDCFTACDEDEACEQECLVLHEDGISDVVQVSGCAGTMCPQACPWGNDQYDDCTACVYDTCEPEMNACLANPACGALFGCFQACPDLDLTCQQACYDAHPDGVANLQVALMCVSAGCETVCE